MACSKIYNDPDNLQELKKENQKFKDILFKGRFESWVFETLFDGGEIFVCALDGTLTSIEVKYSTKISDIKKKLAIPDEVKYRLCFGGRRGSAQLEDHRTLFHYRIPVGSTIHMLMENKHEGHKIISENIDKEKEKFDDQYYIQYYEKEIKEKKEKRLRYGAESRSGKRVGWTGIHSDQITDLETNKLLQEEEFCQ